MIGPIGAKHIEKSRDSAAILIISILCAHLAHTRAALHDFKLPCAPLQVPCTRNLMSSRLVCESFGPRVAGML